MAFDFSEFPIIDLDEQYFLRDMRLTDALDYYNHMNHPKVAPFIPDGCIPKSESMSAEMVQIIRNIFNQHKGITWAIVEKSTNRLIGSCGFDHWERYHSRLEIAYDLHPDYWRHGITSKAVAAICAFAFTEIKINRVEAFTLPDNHPSIQLLLKLGFFQEGLLKEFRFYKGKYVDVSILGLIRADYIQFKRHYPQP
jgi:[ribosomal protein S5]-alanine N-acetyltransferase